MAAKSPVNEVFIFRLTTDVIEINGMLTVVINRFEQDSFIVKNLALQ